MVLHNKVAYAKEVIERGSEVVPPHRRVERMSSGRVHKWASRRDSGAHYGAW